jgi:hypothetical protein
VDIRDNSLLVASIDSSPSSNWCFIMRENGGFFIVKNSTKLVWITKGRLSESQYVGISNQSGGAATINNSIDNFISRMLSGGWLTEYGIATSRIISPVSGDTTIQTADAINELTWTPKTGEVATILFRRIDDDNTLKLVCDQAGTIKLYKRDTGSDTELDAGKTQTWTAGTAYRITINVEATVIKTRVDGVLKHNTTNSYNQTATGVKVISTDGTPNFNNLVCWPKDVVFPL